MCLDTSVKTEVVSLFGPEKQSSEEFSNSPITPICLNLQNFGRFRKYLVLYLWLKNQSDAVCFLHSIPVYRLFFALNFLPLLKVNSCYLVPVRHHNRIHQIENSRKGKFLDWFFARCYKDWVAVSKSVKNCLTQIGVEESKIYVILNGLNISSKHRHYSSPANKFKILSIGRLDSNKNHIAQIRIAEILRRKELNFSIDIFGTGSKHQHDILKFEIEKRNLQEFIFLKGYRSNLPQEFDNYDVLLHTAIDEACPLVIIEGLLSCLPVVSSNAEGSLEILANFYPTFAPDDFEGMAIELIRIHNNYFLALNHAQSILSIVNYDHSGDKMSRNYNTIARELTKKRVVKG